MTEKGLVKQDDGGAKNRGDVVKGAPSNIPKKRGWKVAFGIAVMLAWAGVAIILSQIVVGKLMILLMGADNFAQPVAQMFYTLIAYLLALVLIAVVPTNFEVEWSVTRKDEKGRRVSKGRKVEAAPTRESLGLRGLPTWTDIGLAPVGFVVSLLLAAGLVWVFGTLFPWFDAAEAQNVGFDLRAGGFDRIVTFVTLVVIAPIAEEVIFRGWLYGRLRGKLAGKVGERVGMVISAVLVSLLFGIVHLQWNVGVNVFAMSLVLCAMREITGTVYAGILMHMIKNGLALWLLYSGMVGLG